MVSETLSGSGATWVIRISPDFNHTCRIYIDGRECLIRHPMQRSKLKPLGTTQVRFERPVPL